MIPDYEYLVWMRSDLHLLEIQLQRWLDTNPNLHDGPFPDQPQPPEEWDPKRRAVWQDHLVTMRELAERFAKRALRERGYGNP